MPGIFGFTKKDQSTPLTVVQKEMALYPWFKQDDLFEDDIIAASRVHLNKIGEKNTPIQNDGVFVWVEGEAYNHVELCEYFGYEKNLSFAQCLSFCYQNNKLNDFLNKLDGYFCAAIYDKNTKQVKLISDRYGMRMLYWYWDQRQFAWASEVKGILALNNIDKTIEPTSFDCFMELGYLLGENTWFENIKLIKPATVLTLDLQTNSVSQYHYWSWAEIERSSISFDEAVDQLGTRFIKAVERRFNPNEKIGITLSGGLDSRVIFAAVEHLFPEYKGHAFTFGVPDCDDIIIAKQVVDKSSWDHKIYHFTSDNWLKPRIEKVWNTDGMQDLMHMHGGEFIGDISKNADVNLNGYAGDAIFGGGFLNRTPLNTRISKANSLGFYKRYSSLANVGDAFYNINKVEPNLQMNRVRRFTAMGTVNSLIALDQRKPFFDNDCVELIYSLPDEYRLNNRLYAAMLHKFFPKYFKQIPWQKTGKAVGIFDTSSIKFRVARKLKRILLNFINTKNTKEYTDYTNWIRDKDTALYLKELLESSGSCYSKVTNEDLKNKYLTPHLQKDNVQNENEILRAATIELYLKKSFNKGK